MFDLSNQPTVLGCWDQPQLEMTRRQNFNGIRVCASVLTERREKLKERTGDGELGLKDDSVPLAATMLLRRTSVGFSFSLKDLMLGPLEVSMVDEWDRKGVK